jgi:TadE-like protein
VLVLTSLMGWLIIEGVLMQTLEIKEQQRRKGQTMAEFAITLPILLILVFGIIEFGRVFQAWVTLQNAARNAARYASTGSFDTDRFSLITDGREDPDSIVPCMYNVNAGVEVGVHATRNDNYYPNDSGNPIDRMEIYEGDNGPGDESLFATWWNGTNCDPTNPEHQDLRKDIARIFSVIDQAYVGAAGLALPENPTRSVVDTETAKNLLYDVWERPIPGNGVYWHRRGFDQQSFFEVMVCSSRAMLDEESDQAYTGGRRYMSLRDANEASAIAGLSDPQRAPICALNEVPPAASNSTENPGKPWYDPGNAGDTVTIIITFNHPLITPLGLSPYIPLQARRSAVNESFRVARATDALLGASPTGPRRNIPPRADARGVDSNGVTMAENAPMSLMTTADGAPIFVPLDGSFSTDRDGTIERYLWTINGMSYADGNDALSIKPRLQLGPGVHTIILTVYDNDGAPDSDTIIVTINTPATFTPVPPTNTPLPTSTPLPPFSCDLITASDLTFFNNRVFIQFHNANVRDVVLTRADLHWRLNGGYADMFVSAFAMDGIIHWQGQDRNPSTDTNADVPTPSDIFINADRTLYADSTITWEAVFANGPNPLTAGMTIYDFAGTVFYFSNPTGGPPNPCAVPLFMPTPTPSPTFSVNRPTNTATWTPDCASSQVSVNFVRWDTFGVVVMQVTNRRNTTAIMTDFSINWVQRAVGVMTLERITVGGSGPADSITPTVQVWTSGSATQDANPPTTGGSTAASGTGREGTWLTNYTFPPNSVTSLYVDFGGTTTTLPSAFGTVPSDFNGTWFEIGCGIPGAPGGPGGPGSGGSGRINLFNEATPVPTNTRGPTLPPPPTFTPSRTFTPGPPTRTPTPRPPTNTPAASNTPLPSPTNTLPPTSTPRNQTGPDA